MCSQVTKHLDLRDIGQWLDMNGRKMNVANTQLMVMCGH